MLKIVETKLPNLCFIGDIHGNFSSIIGLIKTIDLNDTAYVFCGDCGFGFEKMEYYNQIFNKIGKRIAKYNCECYFIRGNHESKEYYEKGLINKKRFKTLSDYTVLKTPTHNILCVGGATSIDRLYRIEGDKKRAAELAKHAHISIEEANAKAKKTYWADESPVYDEEMLDALNKEGIQIDIVATHTCPSFADPTHKQGIEEWLKIDNNLETDLSEERSVMDKVYHKILKDGHPLKKWFYGHFHYHNTEFIGDVQFTMLDMSRNGQCDVVLV